MDDAGFELPLAPGPGDRDSHEPETSSLTLHAPLAHLEALLRLGGSTAPSASAARLIEECGSFGAVVASSERRLRRLLGEEPSVIRAIGWFRMAMLDALRPAVGQRIVLADSHELASYLQADMGFSHSERLRVLFLDARNQLLADEVVAHGTTTSLPLGIRHILTQALEVGAAGLILVHNHPSGDPSPSRADLAATASAQRLCTALDIELHDHLIVGAGRTISMREMGALDP